MEEDDVMYSGDEGETARSKAKKRKARWAPNAPTTVNVYGIEFAKLLELCLSKLLVGSDGALRTHLVELKVWYSSCSRCIRLVLAVLLATCCVLTSQDHALVRTRRSPVDKRELLYLPLAEEQVRMSGHSQSHIPVLA